MKKIWELPLVIVFLLLSAGMPGAPLAAKETRVLFLHPGERPDSFWDTVEAVMREAAQDLNMDLTVIYGGRNHREIVQLFEKALSEKKPKRRQYDAVVFQGQKKNGVDLLKIAEKFRVPAFIFNAGLSEEQGREFGGPREKFRYFIGQMLPDDQRAGYDLLNILVDEAKAKKNLSPQDKVPVLAISGNVADEASVLRVKGLKEAIAQRQDVTLLQVTPAQWNREKARGVFHHLQNRYPEANVVWAANDPMALGIIEAKKQRGVDPQFSPLWTGGIDWTPEALLSVAEGKMVATIGGHFMEGAWALVLIHDYLHDRDFAEENLKWQSPMTAIRLSNLQDYLSLIIQKQWSKIDFSLFSKVLNPQIKKYHFDIQKGRILLGKK